MSAGVIIISPACLEETRGACHAFGGIEDNISIRRLRSIPSGCILDNPIKYTNVVAPVRSRCGCD